MTYANANVKDDITILTSADAERIFEMTSAQIRANIIQQQCCISLKAYKLIDLL